MESITIINNIFTSILGSVILVEEKVEKYGDEKLIRYLSRDAVYNNGCKKISVKQGQSTECTCDACRLPFVRNHVVLSVTDNGSGISSEVLERMFEAFYSTKEVGEGSGMGLSTVHGIVHDDGGHISIDTAPD